MAKETTARSAVLEQGRTRLAFLDGLRGVAAMYVVCFHIWAAVRYQNLGEIPLGLRVALSWSHLGRSAVCVFIVLSGFCLMLPLLTSDTYQLRDGFRGYLRRRAKRILPPYLLALVLSYSLALLMEPFRTDARMFGSFMSAPTLPGFFAHLTLTHNVRLDWVWQANAPLWTIVTEWQIYLMFPLILLPVWRRFGSGLTVGVAFAFGLLPDTLLPELAVGSFWFLGLFALGMVSAATLRQPLSPSQLRRCKRVCGGALTGFFLITVICEQRGLTTQAYDFPFLWLSDTLMGIATTCFLTVATHQPGELWLFWNALSAKGLAQ